MRERGAASRCGVTSAGSSRSNRAVYLPRSGMINERDSGWWQPIIVVDEVENFCEDTLSQEGDDKHRNYRLLGAGGVRAYTPSDISHTTPDKNKAVSNDDNDSAASSPFNHVLRLLEPGTVEGELLAQVLRPSTARGTSLLTNSSATCNPGNFLQHSTMKPSQMWMHAKVEEYGPESFAMPRCLADELNQSRGFSAKRIYQHTRWPREESPPRSLAMHRWAKTPSCSDAVAGVEVAQLDERLRLLLTRSRDMQHEVVALRNEMQGLEERASAAAEAARVLAADAAAVHYLEHVLALLRGHTETAAARGWPFTGGRKRDPTLNYIV